MRKKFVAVALLGVFYLFTGLFAQSESTFKIDYEKYKLENGLDVILHEDRSDPIAAVAILYHVGSNREEKGRTGFAHLFEHMLFQESQHVGQDQFFKKIQGAGGTLNGGTWEDGTIYFEVIPKNALEMSLWLESDRMGYLLPTVTQDALGNQQDVVQNEKRQRVDNRPYGHTNYVIHKLLFPENHSYNWQVIGSFEDLQNASIEDIHNFFKKWYGPNNATLVVNGDFDVSQTKDWIQQYFGEIKSSKKLPHPETAHISLAETKRAFHEDNFAKSPELNMIFPTVQNYSKDSYALDFLSELLSDGKKAPLYKVLVEEKKLAPSVSAIQNSREITGYFRIRIRAFPDKSLTDVEKAIFEALTKFENEGFTDNDLSRIKAKTETDFYNGIASILNKAFQLASYNEYAGSPDFITKDIQNYLDVTKEDVWRVYNEYIKGKKYVITSFVPKGKPELIAENSERFPVVEEAIEMAGEAEVAKSDVEAAPVEKIPTSFDRSVEPPKGPTPEITLPKIWTHTYNNGLKIYGIEHNELPLVQFSLTLKGGLLLDDLDKVGVANLMTDIMMEGTKTKTPLELEEAIDELGSRIRMSTDNESIVIQANTLASKLDKTFGLFEEILLEPRWDEKEFARITKETVENINRRNVRPSTVASNVYRRLIYGNDHILGNATLGTRESVEEIKINDLIKYYDKNFSPSVSYITIAGDVSKEDAIKLFTSLDKKWPAEDVKFPKYALPAALEKSTLYFVDVPKAKQSEIRIGYLALPYTHPDYFAVTVMNYKLGGSFNGILNLILREEKGFTYGARSRFSGAHSPGPFTASSSVGSKTTFESMQIFKDEITKYRAGISDEDLAFTRSALVQSNARRFETLGALRGMLNQVANYDLPYDYIKDQEKVIQNMTKEQHQKLAEQYLNPDKMIYLVVGDAETQLEPLKELGLGEPVLLDKEGKQVAKEATTKKE